MQRQYNTASTALAAALGKRNGPKLKRQPCKAAFLMLSMQLSFFKF